MSAAHLPGFLWESCGKSGPHSSDTPTVSHTRARPSGGRSCQSPTSVHAQKVGEGEQRKTLPHSGLFAILLSSVTSDGHPAFTEGCLMALKPGCRGPHSPSAALACLPGVCMHPCQVIRDTLTLNQAQTRRGGPLHTRSHETGLGSAVCPWKQPRRSS